MDDMDCWPPKLVNMLEKSVGPNYTFNNKTMDELRCDRNQLDKMKGDLKYTERGLDFYAYVTPFIIIFGVLGNSVILAVFLSKAMRKMSASFYLASLALSDTSVLLTYVLLDWLQKGLFRWPGKHTLHLVAYQGICETFLLASYGFRFMSVWLIVIFTLERYIGVCHPLHRRGICTKTFAKYAIACVILTSFLSSVYKPIISEARVTEGKRICAFKAEYERVNFILDVVYGLMITAVPFTILTALNVLITRALLLTRQRQKRVRFCSDDSTSIVKLEFTCLLLVVSTCFIALNLPYFVVWCMRLYNQLKSGTSTAHLRGTLYICKTIFSFNYCINFFLYSLTGVNFRRQLKSLFCRKVSSSAHKTAASKTMYSQVTVVTQRDSLTNGITAV